MKKLLAALEAGDTFRNAYIFINVVSWSGVCIFTKNDPFVSWTSGIAALLVFLLWPLSASAPRTIRVQITISLVCVAIVVTSLISSAKRDRLHFKEMFLGRQAGRPAAPSWTDYKNEEIGFTITFPGERYETKIPFGGAEMTQVRARSMANELYQFDFVKIKKLMKPLAIDSFLDRVRDDITEGAKRLGETAQITASASTPIDGFQAREYRFKVENTFTDVRIMMANHVFYRMSVTSFKDSPPENETRFFESFRLLKKVRDEHFDPPSAKASAIKLSPANGDTQVPADLKELVVEFREDMDRTISLVNDCQFGVCFKNAFWRDPSTLVVRVVPKLEPHHKYEIILGGNRPFTSRSGVKLKPFRWIFETR